MGAMCLLLVVTKLNYGVVLKPVTTVDIVLTATWRHTFIVKLPAVPSTSIHRHGMNCGRVSVFSELTLSLVWDFVLVLDALEKDGGIFT